MKARINKNGMLIIEAETEIESYALRHWVNENSFDENMNLLLMCNNPFNMEKETK